MNAHPRHHSRRLERSLFRRLFVINALVFTVGTLVLALSPATVSTVVAATEIPVLLIGLAVILAANALLIRSSLAPLAALGTLMDRVSMRRPDRITDSGNGDLEQLIVSFNTMLDRFETERAASTAQALAAQEGERQRIARELHDEIGQSLTVVLLGLKRVADQAPVGLQDEVLAVQEAARSCLDEVRQVARRLRPGVLSDLGLRTALKGLARDLTAAGGVPVARQIDDQLPAMSSDVELVIYRVAQEALTNVARHARATAAEMSLTADPAATVTLRIADDGVGTVLEESAGIRGMRERARLIGARLRVDSRPGAGTVITLVVAEPLLVTMNPGEG